MAQVLPNHHSLSVLPLDKVALKGDLPFEIPTSTDEVSKDFMTSMLRAQGLISETNEVTNMDGKIIGADKGFTSNVMLCTLKYKSQPEPGTAPEKLVVKVMGGGIKVKKLIEKYIVHHIVFPNEIRFFAECNVPPNVAPFRYPRNYFCATRGENHFMVMEDVSPFGFCGSGFDGSASLEECKSIMMYLARLHGYFWEKRNHKDSPTSVQNFFAGSDLSAYPLVMKRVFPDAFAVMKKAFPKVVDIIGESCLKTISTRFKSIAKRFRTPPFTLCHGDVKLDNIFFAHEKEEGKDYRECLAVDWGVCGWGNPMGDVGYFLGRCVDVEDRRKWLDEMLELYRTELVRINPTLADTYTIEKMKDDLRLMSLVPLFTVLGTLKGFKDDVDNKTGCFTDDIETMIESDKIKRKFMEKSYFRIANLVTDLDAEGKIAEGAVDGSLPTVPCCCTWTI